MVQKSFHDMIEEIEQINRKGLSPEMRIENVTSLLNSQSGLLPESKIYYHLVGDIIHDLIKDHISNFRPLKRRSGPCRF